VSVCVCVVCNVRTLNFYVRTQIWIFIYERICNVRLCVHVRVCVNACVRASVCVYVSVHVCVYICLYTRVSIGQRTCVLVCV